MKSKFEEKIKGINSATNERYNKRFSAKGAGPHALGWGKKDYQIKRFFDLLHATQPDDFRNKTILDIGCGFGDLYDFLLKQHLNPKKYIGIDINDNFIKLARNKHPGCSFETRDLMLSPACRFLADTGVALGVINFKQKNHKKYAEEFIKKSFEAVKEVLIVNVISDIHNEDYQREKFIYYYRPAEWLKFAQSLTPFCSLIQDYEAKPQYEFMLILRKNHGN